MALLSEQAEYRLKSDGLSDIFSGQVSRDFKGPNDMISACLIELLFIFQAISP